jgi:hypothetical protein
VVQSYIGSYGAMIHPVAACATAAASVEDGVDKIRLGKAELVVVGGFDDLTVDGIIGFGDMAATADSEMMRRTASTTGSVRRHGNKSGWGSIWFPSSTSPRKSTGPRGIRGDPNAGTAQGNIVAALAPLELLAGCAAVTRTLGDRFVQERNTKTQSVGSTAANADRGYLLKKRVANFD